ISLPEAVEAMLDKRTSMGIIGDLGQYTQFAAAEALQKTGGSAGDTMGAGIGAGLGMAMAGQMAQQTAPWGNRAAPPPPPPPPVERVWHTAANGKSEGPFSRADLGKMAASGALTRETLVWTAGIDGWTAAGEIDELAQLFTVLPPPPPPVG
ncbi:MAG: GYF domain-containing protein, partial [Pseudomonadota bacterium]